MGRGLRRVNLGRGLAGAWSGPLHSMQMIDGLPVSGMPPLTRRSPGAAYRAARRQSLIRGAMVQHTHILHTVSAWPDWLLASLADVYVVTELVLAGVLVATLGLLWHMVRTSERTRRALYHAEECFDHLSAQEVILRAVAEHANDGLVYQDMSARILWANAAYCRTMGWELAEIVGRRPQEFCFPPEVKPSDAEIEAFAFDEHSYEFKNLVRRPNIRKNGHRFWHEFNLSVVEPRPGEKRVILVSRDVTTQVHREQELERARADLLYAADHDALTGLHNRTAFLTATDKILRSPDAAAREIGLLYIDLDRFKSINDTHGHAAGDRVLVHVAASIRAAIGVRDLSCRMGGDEFVVACPGVSDFDMLQHIADKLLDHLTTPIPWTDGTLTCGASIGAALSQGSPMTAEDLIRSADFALYEAKAPGAPRIARYDASLHERQEAENALMQEFSDALDADAISFAYQPVLDASSGRFTKFETLARWTRANGQQIGPDQFLPYASRLNRMTDVDFAAVRATASLTAELRAMGHDIRGAFNTSSEALAHRDFLTCLEQEARAAGLTPDTLVVEVLETTFFGSDTTDSLAATRISQLRAQGYRVYLDDFGVGYAGLAHLGQLDITGIKLDRSLVANVVHDRSARIIATSILRMCQELGVNALAEGIETAEQADFLAANGCALLQGFGIARPMDRAALIARIQDAAPIFIAPAAPRALPAAVNA